jgi:flagellar biosynthesis protein FlhA
MAEPLKSSTSSVLDTQVMPHSNLILAGGLVTILATLIVPLPTPLLDLLIACSLSLAIAILIITLSAKESLELSTFPSLLLFTTLFRVSLNVASTRLILLQADAGKIIQTFGEFVTGGSFIVGVVIFMILVVIQFIVITKGAERISEVAARFTLDAMPGKQMAIDADLNAGMITEQQANERRLKIVKESEFYGAMDGASKFIRGDAKAALVITIVNIIGGILIGYTHGMSILTALKTYCILSIGDGLVNQLPSVIISISSGFLVTKISSQHSVGQDLSRQFIKASEPLSIASFVIAGLALVPGLPKLPFLLLAAGTAMLGRMTGKDQIKGRKSAQSEGLAGKPAEQPVEELLDVDRVSIHVGIRLISMVDPRKASTVFDRIGALRRKFAQQLGIVIPLVRLRDNINLEPNAYEIRLCDITVAKGRLEPDMLLAMDSGSVQTKVKGIETVEPIFGLPALWLKPQDKERAELNGYTVIDPESVFITHLSETLKKHAHELLSREDVQLLVDRLRKTQPSLVGEVLAADGLVSMGTLQRVLKNLLKDQIHIRELVKIIEALSEYSHKSKNPAVLTEMVRKSLARTITDRLRDDAGKIQAITIETALEHQMLNSVKMDGESVTLSMPAQIMMDISKKIAQAWHSCLNKGREKITLLCDSRLRPAIADMLARAVPGLPVAAYDEIAAEPPQLAAANTSNQLAAVEQLEKMNG